MTVTIDGTHEEIAALVLAVQERRTDDGVASRVIEQINEKAQRLTQSPPLV